MQSNKSEALQWEIKVGIFEEKKAEMTFYDSKIKNFVDESTNRLWHNRTQEKGSQRKSARNT